MVFDAVNGVWYLVDGDYTSAAFCAAAFLPIVGDTATAAKLGTKGIKAVDKAVDATKAIDEAADVAKAAKGAVKEGASTKVTSNLGNEIDITPSINHTIVTENPGTNGTPNSSVDILDKNGNISTRRWYDSNGNAYRDVDMTNHGNPKTHSEYPHEHIWDWTDGNPKRSK